MVELVLAWLGAADKTIAVMGPAATIVLAMLFGGALTQWLKFPFAHLVSDTWYDWTVRTFAVLVTMAFAHILSDSLHWTLEVGVGLFQPIAYRAGLGAVRRWWPWLELSPMVGSVQPPASAYAAAAQRQVDKQ